MSDVASRQLRNETRAVLDRVASRRARHHHGRRASGRRAGARLGSAPLDAARVVRARRRRAPGRSGAPRTNSEPRGRQHRRRPLQVSRALADTSVFIAQRERSTAGRVTHCRTSSRSRSSPIGELGPACWRRPSSRCAIGGSRRSPPRCSSSRFRSTRNVAEQLGSAAPRAPRRRSADAGRTIRGSPPPRWRSEYPSSPRTTTFRSWPNSPSSRCRREEGAAPPRATPSSTPSSGRVAYPPALLIWLPSVLNLLVI